MSKSKIAQVIKLSIVALVALAMPRSAGRGKVKATPPVDDQPDDEASPKAPL
jgi:hypothetical protein